jgi:hypothetical protein
LSNQARNPVVDYDVVTPGYLPTLGIPLIRGRFITDADRAGTPAVVVISESLVRQFQPGVDPIGKRLESGLTVESDLLRSRVYLSSARQQEIQAQGQVEIASAQLSRLMGGNIGAPSHLTAALTPLAASLPPEETLVAEQKKRRPDYQRLAVGDAPLQPAGAVGRSVKTPAGLVKNFVVHHRAVGCGRREPEADLHPLDGRDAHYRLGQQPIQPPVPLHVAA